MRMKYYVYENWLHKKAIVHKSECGFCNDGKGRFPNKEYSSRYGRWLGPFKDKLEAQTAASKTNREEIHECLHCSRQ